MFRLSDIFIGNHPPVEFYGSNPAIYNARYGLQGYPGVRISMPSLTPILAGADGHVIKVDFEEAGKGKYIVIRHEGFETVYAHMNDFTVEKDQRVVQGQLIGHSNQSGLTDIPCLFFGVYPVDNAGVITRQNGYGGAIDPMGEEIFWDIKNLKEPVTKADTLDKMTLTHKEYSALNAQATNYKIIVSYLKSQTEFDDFLKEAGKVPVNLETSPDDSTGGEAVNLYWDALAGEFDELEHENEQLRDNLPTKELPDIVVVKKPAVLVRLWHELRRFVFTNPGA